MLRQDYFEVDFPQFLMGDAEHEEGILKNLLSKSPLTKDNFKASSDYLKDYLNNHRQHTRALILLAVCDLFSGAGGNTKSALSNLALAIDQGDPFAMCIKGICLFQGVGIAANVTYAVQLFFKAHLLGYPVATHALGYCHEHDIGLVKNTKMAVHYYHRASAAGHVSATFNLGNCYDAGRGVERDPVMAIDLFYKAGAKGHSMAFFCLAESHRYGVGVKEDFIKALAFYRKASDLGNAEATKDLAFCYAYEEYGNTKDTIKAAKYFIKYLFLIRYIYLIPTIPHPRIPQARLQTSFSPLEFQSLLGNVSEHTGLWLNALNELASGDINIFIECLLRDKLHTKAEQDAYFREIYKRFYKELSSRNLFLILSRLNTLTELRASNHPMTFFKLVPTEVFHHFAKGLDPSLSLSNGPK